MYEYCPSVHASWELYETCACVLAQFDGCTFPPCVSLRGNRAETDAKLASCSSSAPTHESHWKNLCFPNKYPGRTDCLLLDIETKRADYCWHLSFWSQCPATGAFGLKLPIKIRRWVVGNWWEIEGSSKRCFKQGYHLPLPRTRDAWPSS